MAVADRGEVHVRISGESADSVIYLAGELDLSSVETTKAEIAPYLANGTTSVTFDLASLTFMDSSGIAMFVQISNDVGRVTLINVRPIVHRVLEATGLLEHFGLTT